MADNVKKTSELATTNTASGSDRIVILKDPAGVPSTRTITTNNFAESIKSLVQNNIPNTTVIANSITLPSNGTSNVAFVTYTTPQGTTGCSDLTVHAHDPNYNSVTACRIMVVANTSNLTASISSIEIGDNQILFSPEPTISANVVTLYFTRTSASTSNISIRYELTIF